MYVQGTMRDFLLFLVTSKSCYSRSTLLYSVLDYLQFLYYSYTFRWLHKIACYFFPIALQSSNIMYVEYFTRGFLLFHNISKTCYSWSTLLYSVLDYWQFLLNSYKLGWYYKISCYLNKKSLQSSRVVNVYSVLDSWQFLLNTYMIRWWYDNLLVS